MAARKLRHYFEGHWIRVITNQSLNDLFANKEASTQIMKWGAECQNTLLTLREEVQSNRKSWQISS
jgi:hypothetical protein